MAGTDTGSFTSDFDDEFVLGDHEGNRAYFGLDVLRGLVEGIDDFTRERQPRWKPTTRSLGPALLGSAIWINDSELIDKLATLSAACVIVRKQPGRGQQKLGPLIALNARTPGMPVRAFSALTGLAPKALGETPVVGPFSPDYDGTVPTIRVLGFRKPGHLVPILHTKLALLGHLWWHDEDGTGSVADVVGFDARRLWVSSANFTGSSRVSLEFGFWTEEPSLVQGAERFLVKLMRSSEDVDAASDVFDPDLGPVEFDDQAMADAIADMRWVEIDEEGDDL